MKTQLHILVVGFTKKLLRAVSRYIDGHNVCISYGFTDARHKMKDRHYNLIIVNADAIGNSELAKTCELQRDTKTCIVAVHGGNNRRRLHHKGSERATFLPAMEITNRLPAVLHGCIPT